VSFDATIPEDDSSPFSGDAFKSFYETWRWSQNYSSGTRLRWRKGSEVPAQFPPSYAEFLRHARITSEYLKAEELRCYESKANFAVGMLLTCRIELVIQFHLICRSDEVRKTTYYRARAGRRGFVRVITSLRLEELLSLARRIGLLSNFAFAEQSLDVLRKLSYARDMNGAVKFLRDCRNQVHPANLARKVPEILRALPIDPGDAFNDFYFHYASIAIQVLRAINGNIQFENERVLYHF